MEPIKNLKEVFPVLLFFFPGFVSVAVVELLVVRKEKDAYSRTIEAFLFTVLNLLMFLVARAALEQFSRVRLAHDDVLTIGNVFLVSFCSVCIGLACAYELTNEVVLAKLRQWNFSRKTAKASTWLETFVHAPKFVVIHLDDGRRIYGWPRFYSDNAEDRTVFLEEATWLDEENRIVNEEPISILLDKNSGIKFIEFLK